LVRRCCCGPWGNNANLISPESLTESAGDRSSERDWDIFSTISWAYLRRGDTSSCFVASEQKQALSYRKNGEGDLMPSIPFMFPNAFWTDASAFGVVNEITLFNKYGLVLVFQRIIC